VLGILSESSRNQASFVHSNISESWPGSPQVNCRMVPLRSEIPAVFAVRMELNELLENLAYVNLIKSTKRCQLRSPSTVGASFACIYTPYVPYRWNERKRKRSSTSLVYSTLLSVGRYSPHLVSIYDCNNNPVDPKVYAEARATIEHADQEYTTKLSNFELLSLTALYIRAGEAGCRGS
jgi:hypothetical protein